MSDLKLVQGADQYWDLEWDEDAGDFGDLALTDGLENSVLISIMTIARANPEDVLPDNSDRRRGWFGDAYNANPGDVTGSRIWLLSREKQIPQLLAPLRQLFEECLEWMLQDGVTVSNVVQTAIYARDIMAIRIALTRPGGATETFEYFFNWEAQLLSQSIEEIV